MRKALVILCVMALVVPAMADWYIHGAYSTASGDISVSLSIPCWAEVDWQDVSIVFTSDVPGDWYRLMSGTVRGLYDRTETAAHTYPDTRDKASTDPWANGYYESFDYADIYVKSNCDLTMTVADGNDLTCDSHTLPTWFTICGCGDPSGFVEGGTTHNDGTPPQSSFPGAYLADEYPAPPGTVHDGVYEWGAYYPDQYPFPMTTGGGYLDMGAVVDGTFTVHARVERNNVTDYAGDYTTDINVTFTP